MGQLLKVKEQIIGKRMSRKMSEKQRYYMYTYWVCPTPLLYTIAGKYLVHVAGKYLFLYTSLCTVDTGYYIVPAQALQPRLKN